MCWGWPPRRAAAAAAIAAKSLQLCLTLCDPIDGSPPGFPVPGILQARTLEWVAFPSPVHESEVAQLCPTLATPWTAAYQAPPSMGFSSQEYWSGVPSPDCTFHGILQARILEWVDILFPRYLGLWLPSELVGSVGQLSPSLGK